MSLRARVLIVLLVVTAGVATTVDAVTYVSLRSFLLRRVDQQLDAAHRPIVEALRGAGRRRVAGLGEFAPGLYVEVRTPDGAVADRVQLRRPGMAPVTPTLPAELPVPDEVADGRVDDEAASLTVAGDGGVRYRVSTWRLTPGGRSIVLALPLADVDSTLRRLLAVEAVVTIAALAGGLVLARSLLVPGLRPLDDIATTAGAIAGGDLSRRVARHDDRTEIGRLGAALNAMLGQIERAFAERRSSEERLRRFVADASHELRTPLASIRAYAELFERGADRRPEDLARVDNLLANVRAHTPPRTAARVIVRTEAHAALLVVEDDGPGIPAEEHPRIFERFYRADPSRARDAGGAGLGLAIVAAIAEAHGGRAEVAAGAGGGAEFTVRLPLLDDGS